MISTCSNIITPIDVKCQDVSYKPKMLIWAKKGMATKAMINNVTNGLHDRLQKQIKKGTVKIYPQ